jgi:hypothetical protein
MNLNYEEKWEWAMWGIGYLFWGLWGGNGCVGWLDGGLSNETPRPTERHRPHPIQ